MNHPDRYFCLICGTACRVVGLAEGVPTGLPEGVEIVGPMTKSEARRKQRSLSDLQLNHQRLANQAANTVVPN